MSDTRISRRGAFASLIGGFATLCLPSRTRAAKPVGDVEHAVDIVPENVTLYNYDEQGRLLSVVTPHGGAAATIAV